MGTDDLLAFADQFGTTSQPAPVAVERELHLVVFRLGGEQYAVPIGEVLEVVRVADITRVPHAPAHIRGVMNLRGRILPVVEIRSRLHLDPAELTSLSRVVVVEVDRRVVGLLVDAVGQVTRVGEKMVSAPPDEVRAAGAEAVTGVARTSTGLLVLLDLERVLRTSRLDTSPPMAP
ncbi:MAG: chemotaxis protein CheW [Gemmatimonadales bacterium]